MIMTKKGEWLTISITNEWVGKSIEYILKEFWQVPKKLLHQLRMEKGVRLNNEVFPYTKELQEGNQLEVHLFPKEEYGVIPKAMDIDILYEDDHLLIVNKPAGMDTHPNEERQDNTLSNAIAHYLQTNKIQTKVRHIHRLDKDTTGAVLFAKHALAGAIMDRMLEKREIKRTYIGIVSGRMTDKEGMINQPIGRDRHHPTKRRVSKTGQEAVTHYEVLAYDSNTKTTLAKFELDTGRTHQIRVHMSYIGHPLLGDQLYGDVKTLGSRQALHAAKISMPHPITKEWIQCVAPFLDFPTIYENSFTWVAK